MVTLPLGVYTYIHSEYLRGFEMTHLYNFVQATSVFFFSVISLSILLFLFDFQSSWTPLYAFILGSFLAFLVSSLGVWKGISKLNEGILSSSKENQNRSSILKLAFPFFLNNATLILINHTDILCLKYFNIDFSEIGAYSTAMRIANLIALPIFAINSFVAPKYSSFFEQQQWSQLGELFRNSSIVAFALSSVGFIVLVLFPEFFLGLFNKEFKVAKNLLLILSLGFLINSIGSTNDTMLLMTNNQWVFQRFMAISAVLNIVLNIILIPLLGSEGAAIASVCSYVLWNSLSLVAIRAKLGINKYLLPFI